MASAKIIRPQYFAIPSIQLSICLLSICLTACGAKRTDVSVQGDETSGGDFNLTDSSSSPSVAFDQPMPKIPGVSFPCDSLDIQSSPHVQSVPGILSSTGPVDIHLRSSLWTKSLEQTLLNAKESAGVGAGFRILGTKGGQSPVSAPWSNLDELVILTPSKNLKLNTKIEKVTSTGFSEFKSLVFKFSPRPINTLTGMMYAHTASLPGRLEPGRYRLVFTLESLGLDKGTEISIDVRPGDVDQSFSVNALDQDFISRNMNTAVSSVASASYALALAKADLNSDGRIDKQDMDTFQVLNPASAIITSDFLGEPLSKNQGDIAAIRIRGTAWSSTFQRALGEDLGFTIAPASCLRSLPWVGMNQIVIARNNSAPVFGLITLTRISDGKDFGSAAIEKLPRIGNLSVLSLRSPILSGVYQLKISVNKMSPSLDGVVTRILKFRVLEADMDGNYIVDRMDIEHLGKYYLQGVTSASVRADLNGNGVINSLDLTVARVRQGQILQDPSIPAPAITEVNKVDISDGNGNLMPGIISASINGQVVGKADLNGEDAGQIQVTGPKGSKVLWSNSLNGDRFETVLDGAGEYDGRGHYITFQWLDFVVASVNPGEYQTPQVVALSNQTPGSQIVYSLDGSDLSPNGSKVYSEPLVINQTSVLTVALVRNGKFFGTPRTTFIYVIKPETGGCGRYFGVTAGSFPSTKDECFMKQEEIDTICKDYSGQNYKVDWVRFNSDSTIKEVVNLQSGTCLKLPKQPPTYNDNSDNPGPELPPSPPEFGDVKFEIIRRSDSLSKFQVCINASVNGQTEVELACNRPAPGQQYINNSASFVTLQMRRDTCNILKLSMYVKDYTGKFRLVASQVFDSANQPVYGPGIAVDFQGDAFNIMANDNMDAHWKDLAFTLRNAQPDPIRFKIEGGTGGCQ